MSNAFAALTVGNDRRVEVVHPVRDPRQRAAVAEIAGRDDFEFACNNPFTPEVGAYVGPFAFLFYTSDGALHTVRIGKTGRILRHVSALDGGGVVNHV